MGIYDTNREGAVQIKYTGTHPEAGVPFRKAAAKFVEVLQGQVDIGFNEGFDTVRAIPLSDFTTLKVRVQEAGDEPLTVMEIETNLPEEAEGRPLDEIVETIRCPQMPLSRPGRRMFSHLFGHDTSGNTFGKPYRQRDVPTVQTPYIVPSLEQGAYCSSVGADFPGDGALLKHGRIDLAEPFPFLGRDVRKCYIHTGFIGFEAPNVRVGFTNNIMAKNAPCTIDFQGSPVFVPGIEQFNTGASFAIGAGPGDAGAACAGINFNIVRLIEGSALFGVDELVVAESQAELKGVKEGVGAIGQGDLRQFAIFNFNEGETALNPIFQQRLEYEVVLLYPSKLCPGAIGFFYGGPDGLRPWGYTEWRNCPVRTSPPCKDHYLGPQACNLSTPGSGGSNFVVRSDGGYLIGANRQGVAWIQGNETTSQANPGARVNLNSRSFWIEIDGQGFPTGNGLHNSSPDATIASSSGDLFLG